MEWLSNFFIEGTYSIATLVIIIVSVFLYAARRAHIKHVERLKKIDECYIEQSSGKLDD
ncbi:hypothetical protein L3081_16350 [Colwellia sp. MSW7]|jgi:hypothetical protein|uniref:Heme exporter protein D n=1 Tax=Colwellia maritima TaxID=2912588 RepID=A0ABS9X3B0_9GAMM|nr:hypothetical protein [Colwellia maritima]MCI2284671.1 hypothetical protein [Colwellia maritima]